MYQGEAWLETLPHYTTVNLSRLGSYTFVGDFLPLQSLTPVSIRLYYRH